MTLRLEALPALHGDALLLHYGTESDPHLILVDGGPHTVYATVLRRRLEELQKAHPLDGPLPVRLIIVSHIDEDHIMGILDLASALGDAKSEKLAAVQELWHNTFDDVVGVDARVLQSPGAPAAIIASVKQGKQLHTLAANKLGWVINDDQPLMEAGNTASAGAGVTLTVLGPSRDRIEAFREHWRKKSKPSGGATAKPVEYEDTSPPNLASIVVLATDGQKKILLTGDGRGDCILEGIENAGLMQDGRFPVDVLKVPHHGSIRDLECGFFERIPAKDYVISANGRFNNPDIATLEMLIAARGDDDYNVHLTYPVADFAAAYDKAALQRLIDESQRKKYKIIPRATAPSVIV